MTKKQAIVKKAEWLAYCLEIGFPKSDLDELDAIWDRFKDEHGNLRKPEPQSPAPTKEGLEERAEKYIEENSEWMLDQNHFHITRSFVNTILRQAYIAGAQSSLQPSSPDHTVLVEALKRIEKICLRDWINEEKAQKYFRDTLTIVEEALNKYNNKKEEGI